MSSLRLLPLCLLLACPSPDEEDATPDTDAELPGGLPIAGPGLGNLSYAEAERFSVIGRVDQEGGFIPADDPDAPITFGRPYGTNVVAMHDGYLVVVFAPDSGAGPGGILVLDVSDPRAPREVGRAYAPKGDTAEIREPHSLGFHHLDGRKFMVIATGRGVQFWDLTDATAPTFVSRLDLPGVLFGDYGSVAWQLFWQGSHVYVASAEQGVFVIDASDPTAPVLAPRAGPNPVPPSELGGFRVGPIFAVGTTMVLTSMDNEAGYALVDLSDPVNPALISAETRDTHNAYAYCLGGGWLVNANRGAGAAVTLHDIRDPFAVVTHEGDLTVDDQLYCATQDDHVFLGCQNEVVRLDVSDPDHPVVDGRGSLDRHDADHGQVTPLGNLVYIGNDHGTGSGLMVHDTAPDTTPPSVRWVSPADGETGVARSARVGLVLSDNVTIESAHHRSLRLLDGDGAQVRGTFTVQQNVVNFEPTAPLSPSTTYTVQVMDGGLTDWAGNGAVAWTSSFTTAAAESGDAIGGLLAHWPLDEGWGRRAVDRSSGGSHGELVGGAALLDDALVLDGVDGTVWVNAPRLPPEGPATVTLWLRTRADGWLVDATEATTGWGLRVDGGDLVAVLEGDTSLRVSGVADGAWHHVVLTRAADGAATLSVDDDAADATRPAPRASVPTALWIGSLDGEEGFLEADLRDVRLYAGVLDDGQRQAVADGTDEGTNLRVRLDPVAGEVGAPITLPLRVAGPGQFEAAWSFGDGGAREAQAVAGPITHTFTEPGHHEVTVAVTNGVQRRYATALVTVHRPLPARPPTRLSSVGFTADGASVWASHRDHQVVSRLDVATRTLAAEQAVVSEPVGVVVRPSGERLVSLAGGRGEDAPRDTELFVLDPTGATTWRVEVASGVLSRAATGSHSFTQVAVLPGRVGGLGVSSDGGTLYATRFISPDSGGEVYVVDVTTGDVDTWVIPVDTTTVDGEDRARGLPNYLGAPALSPDGTELWIPAKQDNIVRGQQRDTRTLDFESTVRSVVVRLDAETGEEILPRLDFNNRAPAVDVAFSPRGDWAFVVLQGSHEVAVLDVYTGEPVGVLPGAGIAPDGVAVSPDGRRVVVNGFLSRSLVLYDTSDLVAGRGFAAVRLAEVSAPTVEVLDPVVLAGKRIFYDAASPRMSRDGYLSCATCHVHGGDDGRVWDFTDRGEGLRNTHDLRGRAGMGHGNVHWTGNFDEIQDFENDIRGPFGGAGFLADGLFSAGTRSDPLGDPKAGLSVDLDALAAYVASLDTPAPSPFSGRDPDAEARGADVFDNMACGECHGGDTLTDSADGVRHDVGTLTVASGSRRGGALDGIDTPTLRGVWASPPYLHDGSAPTLRDVLVARNPDDLHGEVSLLLDDALDDLITYLESLD